MFLQHPLPHTPQRQQLVSMVVPKIFHLRLPSFYIWGPWIASWMYQRAMTVALISRSQQYFKPHFTSCVCDISKCFLMDGFQIWTYLYGDHGQESRMYQLLVRMCQLLAALAQFSRSQPLDLGITPMAF